MANRKVPSQAASGKDTFSDSLVGFQITDGTSQLTNTNFAIDKVIPEKDSKTFHTQPFSNFLTLDDIKEETSAPTTQLPNEPKREIKFYDSKNDGAKSLFGSLNSRISVSVTNIIQKFPAALYVDGNSPISYNSYTAEEITYDVDNNITKFKVQNALIFNSFDIILKSPSSSIIPETDNNIRNFYSSFTKYLIELNDNTYNIVSYEEIDSTGKLTFEVNGNPFSGNTQFTSNYLIYCLLIV